MNREIILNYSNAFARDFDVFLEEKYGDTFAEKMSFYNLPFELQLGVFLNFLLDNSIEVEPIEITIAAIESAIVEGIKIYENIAGHYS